MTSGVQNKSGSNIYQQLLGQKKNFDIIQKTNVRFADVAGLDEAKMARWALQTEMAGDDPPNGYIAGGQSALQDARMTFGPHTVQDDPCNIGALGVIGKSCDNGGNRLAHGRAVNDQDHGNAKAVCEIGR